MQIKKVIETQYGFMTQETACKVTEKINEQGRSIYDLERQVRLLEKELKAIRPLLAEPEITLAVSKDCGGCKYVMLSPLDRTIIGCRKNAVCKDYTERDIS